jgi:tetratricopeptide (TPR) repeat protein
MDRNRLAEYHRRVFKGFAIALCGVGLLTCASPVPSAMAQGETFKAPIPKPAGQPPPPLEGQGKPGKQTGLNFEHEMNRLNALISAQNRNVAALFNRAWLYESTGDLVMAEKDYSRVIEIDKQNKDAYYNRGLIKTKMQKHAEAARDFSEVIRIEPGAPDAYCNRGNAYMRLGKADLAVKDYDSAIKAKPNDADLYFNRGLAQLSLGAKAKAVEDFKRASQMGHSKANKYLQ